MSAQSSVVTGYLSLKCPSWTETCCSLFSVRLRFMGSKVLALLDTWPEAMCAYCKRQLFPTRWAWAVQCSLQPSAYGCSLELFSFLVFSFSEIYLPHLTGLALPFSNMFQGIFSLFISWRQCSFSCRHQWDIQMLQGWPCHQWWHIIKFDDFVIIYVSFIAHQYLQVNRVQIILHFILIERNKVTAQSGLHRCKHLSKKFPEFQF